MERPAERQPESIGELEYYHNDEASSRLLARLFEQDLGARVLEVGAGVGHITVELARRAQVVVALEPSPTLFAELVQRTKDFPNVEVHNSTLEEFRSLRERNLGTSGITPFDSVVYINVLEHIKDDVAEVQRARSFLAGTGKVLIVVPAHQWLYAEVDRVSGHFRRYSRSGLSRCLHAASLKVGWIRYFDAVGLLPYLVLYRWCRSTAVSGTNAVVYSRLVLPLSALLYRLTRGRLVGKNLVAMAQQPRA